MKRKLFYLTFLFAVFFNSCKEDETTKLLKQPVISSIEKEYIIEKGAELTLAPEVLGEDVSYLWKLRNEEVARTKSYIFYASKEGIYQLLLKATNRGGTTQKQIKIIVVAKSSLPVVSGLKEKYEIENNVDLKLAPSVVFGQDISYSWLIADKEVASTKDYLFNQSKPGKYKLRFMATNEEGTTSVDILVIVVARRVRLSGITHSILQIEIPEYLKDKDNLKFNVLEGASELYRFSFINGFPLFVAAKEGKYLLQITNGDITTEIEVTIESREKKPSVFISKVFDYMPAPGQFVNKLPEYTKGDTREDMTKKVEELISGEDTYMITLGGWGGYVTVGFDHTIVNVAEKCDFRINGNAFGAADNARPNAPFGGSCEPGIIMVAYDKNKNGKPDDDEWYELAGSSNFSAEKELFYEIGKQTNNDMRVIRDYEMTYHRPKSEIPDETKPDQKSLYVSVKNYIHWTDNKGGEGYKVKNIYHSQTYYPGWIQEDQLSFKGVRLPENGINEYQFKPDINEVGMYFVLYGFRYGYVDNQPNKDKKSAIDIDWAVDKEGNSIILPGIDFVKIYSGVNQENGWLGECSTEVERGEDLHLLGENVETIK